VILIAPNPLWRCSLLAVIIVLVAVITMVGVIGITSPRVRDIVPPDLVGESAVRALKLLKPEAREAMVLREKNRLRDEPLDSSTLDNLSILESLANNPQISVSFASESARRSLRNTASQLNVLGNNLQKKEYALVMYHLDGILVSEPQLGNQLFPSLATIIAEDSALDALTKVLIRNPPWRAQFFSWTNSNDKSGQIMFRLFGSLRKQGDGPSDSELQAYIAALFDHKAYDRAYFVWLDSLGRNELRKVGYVFDGNFDLDAGNKRFDWNLITFANAEIGIAPRRQGQTDRALHLSFYHSAGVFGHVFQYLRLQQGRYHLEGEQSAWNFQSPGGLRLIVYCSETGVALGGSEAFKSPAPWKQFSFDFEVPAESCLLPILRLQSASTAILDTAMNGEILFDKIKIDKIDSH
jgi:hypothetical protein